MRVTPIAVAGVVVAVLGAIFALQGFGVLEGSSMSNTTTWSVAGPIIFVVGLVVAWLGSRRRD